MTEINDVISHYCSVKIGVQRRCRPAAMATRLSSSVSWSSACSWRKSKSWRSWTSSKSWRSSKTSWPVYGWPSRPHPAAWPSPSLAWPSTGLRWSSSAWRTSSCRSSRPSVVCPRRCGSRRWLASASARRWRIVHVSLECGICCGSKQQRSAWMLNGCVISAGTWNPTFLVISKPDVVISKPGVLTSMQIVIWLCCLSSSLMQPCFRGFRSESAMQIIRMKRVFFERLWWEFSDRLVRRLIDNWRRKRQSRAIRIGRRNDVIIAICLKQDDITIWPYEYSYLRQSNHYDNDDNDYD